LSVFRDCPFLSVFRDCPFLSVFRYCPFLFAISVFSNVYVVSILKMNLRNTILGQIYIKKNWYTIILFICQIIVPLFVDNFVTCYICSIFTWISQWLFEIISQLFVWYVYSCINV
jgi:hypothetical protein